MFNSRLSVVWWITLKVAVSEVCLEPFAVVRSPDGDLIRLARQNGASVNGRCPERAPTYLVGEEIPCVDKVEALGGCNSQLVPRLVNTFSTDSIQSFIAENGNLMVLDSATNQYGVGRLFSLQGTRQRGSNCRVTGLTLLRGNRVLSHQGFSATSGREITIVVTDKNLMYPKEDYDGEVFRMNISCRDNSQVNCVVFKLNGTTHLKEGKFNGSLLPQATNYCSDPDTQYIIAGSLSAVVLLLCAAIAICTACCYLHHKHSSSSSEKSSTPTEEEVVELGVTSTSVHEEHPTKKLKDALNNQAGPHAQSEREMAEGVDGN